MGVTDDKAVTAPERSETEETDALIADLNQCNPHANLGTALRLAVSLERRLTAALRERDAVRSALLALEQAYANKHSPQHRSACLTYAASVLASIPPAAKESGDE